MGRGIFDWNLDTSNRKPFIVPDARETMATSDFWRDLAVEFRALDPKGIVFARWDCIIKSGRPWQWQLVGGNPGLHSRFEALARRAASEMPNPEFSDLLISWLEAIRKTSFDLFPNYYIEVNEDGSEGAHHETGLVKEICEASATLCSTLESEARQSEFEARQRNDPRNWPYVLQRYEATKQIKELISGPHEQVSETFLRNALAEQYGIKPEDVTWQQLRRGLDDLGRYYPGITLLASSRNIEAETAPEPTESPIAESAVDRESEIERRQKLLADYKLATGDPSDYSIYKAKNSGIHKPQFYQWRKGTLSSRTKTAQNFERFLQEKKPPIPRKPQV